ncbi:MAG: hypothetical protein U5K74_14530 [Gemmatimonadaceae bacterium]|nr:hypothetical protein [Gemmatimonadaceae bacterium]
MTIDSHDESAHVHPGRDALDPALDSLLRRADRGAPVAGISALEARIMAQAALPLAARRRDTRAARTSTADTLAAWVRVAMPLAAAAAIFAAVSLYRADTSTMADAELRDSDPAALLSALESDDASGLALHLVAEDVDGSVTAAGGPR